VVLGRGLDGAAWAARLRSLRSTPGPPATPSASCGAPTKADPRDRQALLTSLPAKDSSRVHAPRGLGRRPNRVTSDRQISGAGHELRNAWTSIRSLAGVLHWLLQAAGTMTSRPSTLPTYGWPPPSASSRSVPERDLPSGRARQLDTNTQRISALSKSRARRWRCSA
jgi:hypothetical protein